MAESDWHMRDLLQFYVSKSRSELLGVANEQVHADDIFTAVRRVRELMLIMSCMVGAFTPSEIAALNRLDQIRLVAENEAAQMLRIGEEMALLRLWTRTAVGPQWNIADAIRILRTGRPLPSSCFPEMTCDLLTSLKKPYIVPSVLPSNSDAIRRVLRESIELQFFQSKSNHPFIPNRVQLLFNPEDDSVTITSPKEFKIRGIYDNRRWTIMEAQILDDVAKARECRQLIQALNISSIGEMCAAALRMATAHRLKLMQEEAQSMMASCQSSIHSIKKEATGLGQGFKVLMFAKLDENNFFINCDMNFDNGDFQIVSNLPNSPIPPSSLSSFNEYVEFFEHHIRQYVFETHSKQLGTREVIITQSALLVPEIDLVVSLNANGSLLFQSTHFPQCSFSSCKFLQFVDIYEKLHLIRQLQSQHQICAVPSDQLVDGAIELVSNIFEVFEALIKSPWPLPPIQVAYRSPGSPLQLVHIYPPVT